MSFTNLQTSKSFEAVRDLLPKKIHVQLTPSSSPLKETPPSLASPKPPPPHQPWSPDAQRRIGRAFQGVGAHARLGLKGVEKPNEEGDLQRTQTGPFRQGMLLAFLSRLGVFSLLCFFFA